MKTQMLSVVVLLGCVILHAENWVYLEQYPWAWSNERQTWIYFCDPSTAVWDSSEECWTYLGLDEFDWKEDLLREFEITSDEINGVIQLSDTRSGFFGKIEINSINDVLLEYLDNEQLKPYYDALFDYNRVTYGDGYLILDSENFTLMFALTFKDSLSGSFECSVLSRVVEFPIPYRFQGNFFAQEYSQ